MDTPFDFEAELYEVDSLFHSEQPANVANLFFVYD